MQTLRDEPLDDAATVALLIIDVQYAVAALGHGDNLGISRDNIPPEKQYYFDRLERILVPNIKALQTAFRKNGSEVIFTTVENLTDDGRDRSLDYKVSGINVAKGSREAQVLDDVAPLGDEMRLPKTTSSAFNSTIIDYLLRNLGIKKLVIVGLLTDQCVISAVRDACDQGYIVIVPEDACATYSRERHDWALELTKGYCRITTTKAVLTELKTLNG